MNPEYNLELERFFDQVDERNEAETEPATPHRITDEEWEQLPEKWEADQSCVFV